MLSLRRLVRQRSRWFQGHLQSGRSRPLILRDVPIRPALDLLYHLSSPVLHPATPPRAAARLVPRRSGRHHRGLSVEAGTPGPSSHRCGC
ncbi:hypothetical protein ACRAWF_42090 [Streptomyces sp. L7]